MGDLADALVPRSSRKVSYPTYRAGTGSLANQMNIYSSRQKVLSALPHGLPIPALVHFETHEQASIYLTMASLLLAEEQKIYLKSIELNLHTGRVHALGGLVCLSLSYAAPLASFEAIKQ